jgi:hypothetical protein
MWAEDQIPRRRIFGPATGAIAVQLRQLLEQHLPARPGIVAGFFVGFVCVWRFAFPHETVTAFEFGLNRDQALF